MSNDSLKTYRIPFEIKCRGIEIQLSAIGRNLSLRIIDDPSDDGDFEKLIRVDECAVLQSEHPKCYRAYRLTNGQWKVTRHHIERLGFQIIHWIRPRD
ncbi:MULTISPECIES: hypothetical protein [Sphingomonadaceae]|uniref:hypothetical protein n=1 Tax=Sphingomonadaceae TaxID=41297 RepID=UPI0011587A15|nr:MULTISPECIES: hypothetical protein [Sphingomonadaceae]